MTIRTPTIHLNGSNPETLLEGLTEAYRAVDAAMRALDEAAPNGRDYYPQGPDAVQEATREHQLRAAKLRSVHAELEELVVSVQDQIDARDEREAARARRNPRRNPSVAEQRRIAHLAKPPARGMPGGRSIAEMLAELKERGAILRPTNGKMHVWLGDRGWPIGKIEEEYFLSLPPSPGEEALWAIQLVDDDSAYWSDHQGDWVSIRFADRFSPHEKTKYPLPEGGEWVRV